ncbi:DUF6862 domain-containing protein [Amphibiibacter pelophylacis]|uniref:Uncharacterized protein n=1 Tax=Amphibiibacter pelophylacis TaxID=1799477 RepID=A0ACC6NZH0_9BURK
MNTAAVTAANAAQNNWLAHADILRRKQLESERASCRDEACRQDKDAQLKAVDALDKTRDAILRQACTGNNPTACQAEQQKVRSAAAEIVRDARLSIIVSADGLHTISQAAGGMSVGSLLFETGKGTRVSIVQPYADAATFIVQLVSDPNAAWDGVTARADDVKRAAAWIAQNAEKYEQLVDLSSQKLRNSLASALESGDEKQIGAAMGAMASVFIPEPGKKAALADDLVREVSILSRIEESAAKAVKVPTASGYLNKAKLGEAVIVPPRTWDQTLMMQDIIANGDRLGTKKESLVSSLLASAPNIKVLSGTKYSGNNGLDLVIQFVDPADGVTKTMVIDSKQLDRSGSTSLEPKAAGGVMQLSDGSLGVIGQRLTGQGSPIGLILQRAIANQTLVKAAAFVD